MMRVITLILVLLILFVSGCQSIEIKESIRSVCGDNICDIDETCACDDCKSEPQCQPKKQEFKEVVDCNDNNPCTNDIYNNKTKKCEYEIIKNCCGNNICEENERCNEETHTTNCIKDCKLTCPSFLILHRPKEKTSQEKSFGCNENCKYVKENEFEIINKGSVITIVENIGEFASGPITSNFLCSSGTHIANNDEEKVQGIKIRDYFDDKKQKVYSISGKGHKNKASYILEFEKIQDLGRGIEVICVINLVSSPSLSKAQSLKVVVK